VHFKILNAFTKNQQSTDRGGQYFILTFEKAFDIIDYIYIRGRFVSMCCFRCTNAKQQICVQRKLRNQFFTVSFNIKVNLVIIKLKGNNNT